MNKYSYQSLLHSSYEQIRYDSLCHVTASIFTWLPKNNLPFFFPTLSPELPNFFQISPQTGNRRHVDSVSANFFFLCGAISTKDAKDSESDGIAGICWGAARNLREGGMLAFRTTV